MKSILIIDDSQHDTEVMIKQLNSAGFSDVMSELQGERGRKLAEGAKPDLAIVDTILSDTDGFKVCKQIKGVPNSKTKVIIITGKVEAIDASKAREHGADDYVVKTTDYAHLVQAAVKLIGK